VGSLTGVLDSMSSGLSLAARRRLFARLLGEAGRHDKLEAARLWTRWSRAQVERARLERLHHLLIHASTHVPYWRELFRGRGLDPRTADPVEVLRHLPLLTRETIRREGPRMYDERLDLVKLLPQRTGGTTGEPLRFYRTRDELEAQMAISLRGFELAGVPDSMARARIWAPRPERKWESRLVRFTGQLQLDAFDLSDAAMRGWVEQLVKHRIGFLYGYVSAVDAFAMWCLDHGVELPALRVVGTTAERLHPEQQQRIAAAFKTRVANFYGAREILRIASSCEHGGMHVAADSVWLESPGENQPGMLETPMTSLISESMPLIRYVIGDVVTPAPNCDCGLPFDCIAVDVGKVHRLLTLPNGERVSTSRIYQPLCQLDTVARFQVCLLSDTSIEIRYVARAQSEASTQVAATLDATAAALRGQVRFRAQPVAEIVPTAGGKRPVILDLRDAEQLKDPR
jgi:phenylacetate-CoA ligase